MTRLLSRAPVLALVLLLTTIIPIVSAALRIYQVPLGLLPPDALKFEAVPWAHFLHAAGGLLFGLLGPLQFAGALKQRFGRLHRISGRVFVVAGLLLGFSSLRLVAVFPDVSTWVLTTARIATGLALCASLILAVWAIYRRRVEQHRAWMIRAYAIGMGAATISFIMLPIFLITGEAPVGYGADLLFVLSWVINLSIAEWIIRRLSA